MEIVLFERDLTLYQNLGSIYLHKGPFTMHPIAIVVFYELSLC